MGLGAREVLSAITIGIGATLVMDLWNLLLKRAFGLPSLDYCLLGRWVRHMPEGTLRHANIRTAPRKSHECAVGWMTHYSIGIGLAVGFVVLTSGAWLVRPTLLPALVYGIGTVVFPFFVMQPSLGLGVASSKTPIRRRPGSRAWRRMACSAWGCTGGRVGVSQLLGARG